MEQTIAYTDCKGATEMCSEAIKNKTAIEKNCNCNEQTDAGMKFEIKQGGWNGDVFIYYELENFYQNHRRYVKSRDDKQLLGNKKIADGVNTDCQPFDKCKKGDGECMNGFDKDLPDETPFLPCGAIANSLFSGRLIIIQYTLHCKLSDASHLKFTNFFDRCNNIVLSWEKCQW